jgi:penicillin-binding protein 1C
MLDYGRRARRQSKYFTLSIPTFGKKFTGFNRSLNNTPKIVLYQKLTRYAFFGLIGFVVLMTLLFIWYGRELPAPGKLIAAQANQSSGIYDRNGELLYSVYQDQNRIYVGLKDIPKYVQQGTISIEDKNFYQNKGFSVTGYIRGLIIDPILRRRVSGGSTITQQLVKNVLLTSERTLPRKVKELMLAIQVDSRYSKDQILEMYLNDVPYGGTAIGVQAASQIYFNKDVKELDLAESAFLAGLPQGPSLYSPFSGNKYYLGRTKEVLKQMENQGYITQKQADDAYKEIEKKEFKQTNTGIKAPHFVFYVKQQLIKQFGEAAVESGGLIVKTTLDYKIEKEAEKIVKEEVDKVKNLKVGNASAMVTIPKTGEILAMVGSKDYFDTDNDGNFNAATSYRQPGSSLKPVTYATAFTRGYTPSTLLMDTQTNFKATDGEKDYIPVNYDGKFRGPVQVRFALANSFNIPAVKMLAQVGIKNVMQKAYEMGIDNWDPTEENLKDVGYSLVLGGRDVRLLDEVEAYGVFANGGEKQPLVSILEVKDSKGNTLYKYNAPSPQRVFSQEVSFLISHILLDNNARSEEFGQYSKLVVAGKPSVSVKTGTTNEIRDNWTVGYTPSYVVGVWVGNNDNTPMSKVSSGITGAAPIWNRIISFVLKDKKDEPPKKPDGVVAVQIDAYGGGLPVSGRPTRSEYFVKGTEPTSPSSIYAKVRLSKSQSGKLASASEISAGDYDTKDYIIFKEEDPISTDGKNRWQEGIDAWIRKTFSADKTEYYPPTETSTNQINSNNSNPTSSPTPTPTGILPTVLTPTPTP